MFRQILLVAAFVPGMALAQSTGHDMTHMEGMDHNVAQGGALPSEPGQGGFAAVAEIVKMLDADPETDWSKVDIAGLRAHLVDMDMVFTHAQPEARPVPGGVEITLPLSGEAGPSIARMVPAHGPVLQRETGWKSQVVQGSDKIIWTVTDPAAEAQIRALGFFGLIATGDHHRAHHIAMARGAPSH